MCLAVTTNAAVVFATDAKSAFDSSVDSQEAEALALSDAGISADAVQQLRTKSEREHGENIYEISFAADGIEYEYQIREADGKILEWEIDGRNINDAVAEVTLSKLKFEDDNHSTIYEIEFYQNRQEFEYEIDAYTGEILKMERDQHCTLSSALSIALHVQGNVDYISCLILPPAIIIFLHSLALLKSSKTAYRNIQISYIHIFYKSKFIHQPPLSTFFPISCIPGKIC